MRVPVPVRVRACVRVCVCVCMPVRVCVEELGTWVMCLSRLIVFTGRARGSQEIHVHCSHAYKVTGTYVICGS